MSPLLKFNKTYFILTVTLFIVEVLIARFVHDRIVRPYIGDVLVVILIYCFVKSFLNTPVLPTAIAALLFAYFVEALQYLNIVNKLHLQRSFLARTIIGTSFEWTDMAAYTCGIMIVLYLEYLLKRNSIKSKPIRVVE